MARYGTGLYDTFPYGYSPQIALSIDPFSATALDYQKVEISWTSPIGDFVRFRLIRNQDGVPETEEDGIILLDLADGAAISNTRTFMDGEDNVGDAAVALIPGKYAYYSVWLLLTDNTWVSAGTVSTLLAAKHEQILGGIDRTRNTHERFMDLLPRVFTSSTGSPIDVVDPESDLYNFLYSFSYTLDEALTFIDLLLPNHLFTNYSPRMLDIRGYELGFAIENRASTRFQRRLVREAAYIASRKGTALATEDLIESMTGYIPTVTASPNLMLTTQDSTFRGGVGSWRAIGPCTLSTDTFTIPPTTETHSLDAGYTGKVVVTVAGAKITNGVETPITRGIPVVGGTAYTFSIYAMSATSAGLTQTVTWYDRRGTSISSTTSSSSSVNGVWAKKAYDVTAPATAIYASIEVTFSTVTTYHLDLIQFAETSLAGAGYTEARGVRIALEPTKRNLIANPSFEHGTYTTGWTRTGTSTKKDVTSGGTLYGPPGIYTGLSYLSLAPSGNATSLSTSATADIGGTFYAFSIYTRTESLLMNQTVTLTATLAGKPNLTNSVVVNTTELWERVHVTLYLPTEYVGATLTCTISSADNPSVTLDYEAAQLEVGFKPTDFFDGSYTVNGAEWSGTSNNSVSYMFQNKAVKLERLKAELPQYLPLGTGYTVESLDGIEFSGWA